MSYESQPGDLRSFSTGGPAVYDMAAAATELLPPRAPPRATSIDSGLDPVRSLCHQGPAVRLLILACALA